MTETLRETLSRIPYRNVVNILQYFTLDICVKDMTIWLFKEGEDVPIGDSTQIENQGKICKSLEKIYFGRFKKDKFRKVFTLWKNVKFYWSVSKNALKELYKNYKPQYCQNMNDERPLSSYVNPISQFLPRDCFFLSVIIYKRCSSVNLSCLPPNLKTLHVRIDILAGFGEQIEHSRSVRGKFKVLEVFKEISSENISLKELFLRCDGFEGLRKSEYEFVLSAISRISEVNIIHDDFFTPFLPYFFENCGQNTFAGLNISGKSGSGVVDVSKSCVTFLKKQKNLRRLEIRGLNIQNSYLLEVFNALKRLEIFKFVPRESYYKGIDNNCFLYLIEESKVKRLRCPIFDNKVVIKTAFLNETLRELIVHDFYILPSSCRVLQNIVHLEKLSINRMSIISSKKSAKERDLKEFFDRLNEVSSLRKLIIKVKDKRIFEYLSENKFITDYKFCFWKTGIFSPLKEGEAKSVYEWYRVDLMDFHKYFQVFLMKNKEVRYLEIKGDEEYFREITSKIVDSFKFSNVEYLHFECDRFSRWNSEEDFDLNDLVVFVEQNCKKLKNVTSIKIN